MPAVSEAISTAASAASNPLFPIFSPARSMACSKVLASKHAKRMRNPSLLRRLPNPPRHFVHDHVIMRRIAAQQTSETNDRVIFLSLRQLPRRQRNLKRPRHPHQINIFS